MNAKEYLEQIETIDEIIISKSEEILHWKAIAQSTTAPIQERVQSSGSMQKMADAVNTYVDIEASLNEDIARYVKERCEIISLIEKLSAKEYKVLHSRYVLMKSFKEIGADNKKDDSWATTVHGRALIHLQGLLDRKVAQDE